MSHRLILSRGSNSFNSASVSKNLILPLTWRNDIFENIFLYFSCAPSWTDPQYNSYNYYLFIGGFIIHLFIILYTSCSAILKIRKVRIHCIHLFIIIYTSCSAILKIRKVKIQCIHLIIIIYTSFSTILKIRKVRIHCIHWLKEL